MDFVKVNPLSLKRVFRQGIVLSVLLAIAPVCDIIAGVLVAPPAVFISEKGRTGRLTVQNPTDEPKEITISMAFGIPESDSLGNVDIHLKDSAVTDPRSAMEWIRAFPRKLIIPGNGSQVVRFVANPPKDLPDGEYWARVIVQSREGVTEMPAPTDDDKITTKLRMIMRTAVVVKYRKGDLVASVELDHADVRMIDSTVEVTVDLSSKGNVSYVGVLTCRLLDAEGNEIGLDDIDLAVYRTLRRRMKFPVAAEDLKGPYQVEVTVTNKGRKDISAEDMIFGNEIFHTMSVEG